MKSRVSMVARDLGVTPRDLIQYLNGVGEPVKTPSSLVSLEAANRARIHFSSRARHAAPPPGRRLPATTRLHEPETETDEISPVDPASGYSVLDVPFWSPELYPAFRQALDWLRSSPRRAPDHRLEPRPLRMRRWEREELTAVGRLFLPRGRGYVRDDVTHAMIFARSWEFFG